MHLSSQMQGENRIVLLTCRLFEQERPDFHPASFSFLKDTRCICHTDPHNDSGTSLMALCTSITSWVGSWRTWIAALHQPALPCKKRQRRPSQQLLPPVLQCHTLTQSQTSKLHPYVDPNKDLLSITAGSGFYLLSSSINLLR